WRCSTSAVKSGAGSGSMLKGLPLSINSRTKYRELLVAQKNSISAGASPLACWQMFPPTSSMTSSSAGTRASGKPAAATQAATNSVHRVTDSTSAGKVSLAVVVIGIASLLAVVGRYGGGRNCL